MAYGIPPQLYPYLYAPKAALGMHSSPSSHEPTSDASVQSHHKMHSSKEYEDMDDKNNEEALSSKDGDEMIDENENVEID
jgi:hypothetical protein